MPQLNFSPQFAPAVESGAKRQTIRATRKVPIKAGDTLYLFTGLRTKQARRLLPPQVCKSALWIEMKYTAPPKSGGKYKLEVRLQFAGKLTRKRMEQLAKEDGFNCIEDFIGWFLPAGTDEFNGQLIKWETP